MARVVGRSSGYGVHLRFCSPSASATATSLVPLSRLASCFFLRFSRRNHWSRLCTLPSPYSLRTSIVAHSEGEQDGSSSSSAYCSQLPAVKRITSRKKNPSTEGAETEPVLGDQGNSYSQTTACEDIPSSVSPVKKVTRRKKKLHGLLAVPLTAVGLSEDITAKKQSSGKKMVIPDTGTIGSSEQSLSDGIIPVSEDKSRSSRKKKSTTPELEGVLENATSPTLQMTSKLHTSPLDALPEMPRKSARRKRTSSVGLVEGEMSVSPEKTTFIREDENTAKKDSMVEVIQVKRERKKKIVSSQFAEEGSPIHVNSETSTACKKFGTSIQPANISPSETIKNIATLAAKEERIPLSVICSSEMEKETTWNKERARIAGGEQGPERISSLVEINVLQERGNPLADHLGGSKQMLPERTMRGTEKAYCSKQFSAGNNQRVLNKESNTLMFSGKANQSRGNYQSPYSIRRGSESAAVQSTNSSISSTECVDAPLAEGYCLANMGRASGTERKGRKEFFVRKVLANQASTLSYMQIYGTGFDTGETLPTVLLFFDRRRFIFNVGEGLQRFCMEHRFKLSKIDHVFLTRVCSETAGGLPGLILTLAELGETGQTVQTWGPSSLQDLAQALRTFVPSSWMDHTHCFAPTEDDSLQSESGSSPPLLLLEDELIKISAVLLHSSSDDHNEAVSEFRPEGEHRNMVSTVYICELSEVKGKFDAAKALAKGLKPGYKYGRLQRGEPVMSDDGTTKVHPEDVLGPSSRGPVMLLVDCPSMSYLTSLVSCTSLQSYLSQIGKTVNCMIHLGPTSVTKSCIYKCWMENFTETHHIMARQDSEMLGTPTLKYSAKVSLKLSHVCPQLFSVAEPDVVNIMEGEGNRIHNGENLLKFHFRPLTNLGLDSSDVPEAFIRDAIEDKWSKEFPEVERARQIIEQAFSTPQSSRGDYESIPPCLQHVSREEMELVFLGTGSSQPSKHRNVTGIYIHLFYKGGLLLDCGEGTYAQLKRRYGAKGADDVLRGLKCIWISHMHADHFAGLPRILSARRQLLSGQFTGDGRILVIGPRSLRLFLDAYEKVEDLGVEYLDCSQTTLEVRNWASSGSVPPKVGLIHAPSDSGRVQSGLQHYWRQPGFHIQQGIDVVGREKLKSMLSFLGLKDLISVPVVHCPNAFAVVLEAQGQELGEGKIDGWKLVFSGDTRPCQGLVEAAHGATIFIHEATFDDGMIADAVKKNHSVTKEAIEVGVAADVYRIFLTHFSQRYPTIPLFDTCYSDRTCIAFDMMSVNLVDLPIAPKIVPALQILFKDETDAESEEDPAMSV